MKDFFFCVFVLLLSSYGFSQEDNSGEILTDSVEYSFQGKYVFVTYDLNKSPKMLYNTYLEIYDSSNNKIPVKPLSGEFSSVKPGKGKRMVWRIDSDSIYSINGLKVYTVIES